MLDLCHPEPRPVHQRDTVAEEEGVSCITGVEVGLREEPALVQARLVVRVDPVLGLPRTESGELDTAVVGPAVGEDDRSVVGEPPVRARLEGVPLQVEVP